MTRESKNDGAFWTSQNQSLATAIEADDFLHPELNAKVGADSTTETQYFGFCIPEVGIHAYGYLWHHPRLKVVTGGLMVYRGVKATPVAAELCDMLFFVNDSVLSNDLYGYRLPNSYAVEVLEPLRRHRMTYSDPDRKNSVDLQFEALAPPAMFGNRLHFEQPMRVQGDLLLRGERFKVDCYTVRDRSWGKPRPEDNLPMPPYSWMSGVFGPDFSFNCGMFDQAVGNPEVRGRFELPAEKVLSGGWLYKDGQMSRLKSANKRVVRDRALRIPAEVEFAMTDDLGRNEQVRGTLVSSIPWAPWTNLHMTISLMRWECGGRVAYGDCQEAMWNDYMLSHFSQAGAGASI
jgi:hypothetical protein